MPFMRLIFAMTTLFMTSLLHASDASDTTDAGWVILFDGSSMDAWREYNRDVVTGGWKAEQGMLTVLSTEQEAELALAAGESKPTKREARQRQNLITKEKFGAFELQLEFKVTPGANSGVMYHVVETDGPPHTTGPEIQIQDNSGGHDPQKCGWLYQLYAAKTDAVNPTGQWNRLQIRVTPEKCVHTLNGVKYVEYVKGSDDWNAKVAASKFAKWDGFGEADRGHICLQDHGDEVSYRNIRIRPLD